MPKVYRFKGNLFHDRCVVRATYMTIYAGHLWPEDEPEEYLDRAARFKKVDRDREETFTEDQFPKTVNQEVINIKSKCNFCNKTLGEEA